MTETVTRTACPGCGGELVRVECEECLSVGQLVSVDALDRMSCYGCPWCAGQGAYWACARCDSVPEYSGTFEEE